MTFSSFAFYTSMAGTPVISPDLVKVTPLESGGLRFDLGGFMSQTGLTMPWLDFTVTASGAISSASFTTVQGVPSSGADVFICPGSSATCSAENMLVVRSIRNQPVEAETVELPSGPTAIRVHSLLIPGRDEMVEYNFKASDSSSVPEPAASALLGTGLLALTLLARRRRRA